MATETLQEKLIAELFDPRNSLSPREHAAAEEIRALRAQLGLKAPAQKAAEEPIKPAGVKGK